MQKEKIFKILFNPFRLISLLFLYVSYFWAYVANFIDFISNSIVEKLKILNNIQMSNRVGKLLILLLLIFLFYLWFDYIGRIVL